MQIADPSNDVSALENIARIAHREGIAEVVVGLTYSISEVHTVDYYRQRGRRWARAPTSTGSTSRIRAGC